MAFTPQAIPNPRRFFALQEQYKQRLMEDSQLNKAAALAAEEDMVLNSNLPFGIKVAVAKPLSRQVRQWTKRVRQPGVGFAGVPPTPGMSPGASPDLAQSPMSTLLKQMIKASSPSTSSVGKSSVKKATTPSGIPRPVRPKKVSFSASPSVGKKSVKEPATPTGIRPRKVSFSPSPIPSTSTSQPGPSGWKSALSSASKEARQTIKKKATAAVKRNAKSELEKLKTSWLDWK